MTDRNTELEAMSDAELSRLLLSLSRRNSLLTQRRDAHELVKTLARRRALGFASATITGGRLDVRIEKLFDAIHAEKTKIPVNEVLRVFDGIAGRIISKRIWIAIIAVFTILPAIASLWLLASQNKSMIEQNQVEEDSDYRTNVLSAMEILNGTFLQNVSENGEFKLTELPMHHPRIRAEAFDTLVSLQKMRWKPDQKERYLEFRGCNLSNLALGGSIGLLSDLEKRDFTRLYLEGANLNNTKFYNSPLDGCVFRNAQAAGIQIVSPGAKNTDFSGMQAPGALFSADFQAETPLEMDGVTFDKANLSGATFDQALITSSSFDQTDLSGAIFEQCNIAKCDFSTANLGAGIDWSNTGLHKCLLTDEQLKTVQLAPFCTTEPGDTPGTVRVMTDIDKCNAWFAERQAEMEALAKEELRLLEEKKVRIDQVP